MSWELWDDDLLMRFLGDLKLKIIELDFKKDFAKSTSFHFSKPNLEFIN